MPNPRTALIGAFVVLALWALVIWTESSQDLSTWQLLKERAANRPATFWGSALAGALLLPRIL
jgi:hypothetical protein